MKRCCNPLRRFKTGLFNEDYFKALAQFSFRETKGNNTVLTGKLLHSRGNQELFKPFVSKDFTADLIFCERKKNVVKDWTLA